MSDVYPIEYHFGRRLRVPQALRAALVVVVGGVSLFFSAHIDLYVDFAKAGPWRNIAIFISGFILFSGMVGLCFVLFATVFHKPQTIEVTQEGLKVTRLDKNGKPYSRSLRWDTVTSYSKDAGGFIELWDFTPSTYRRTNSVDDLWGCAFGVVVNLYLVLLEFFITGFSWQLTFHQEGKRAFTISGFGKPMNELVFDVLPRFLAGKEIIPGAQPAPPSADG